MNFDNIDGPLVSHHETSSIKTDIYNRLSNTKCPVCRDGTLYIGAVSLSEDTPTLYCDNCVFRMIVNLVLIAHPGIED